MISISENYLGESVVFNDRLLQKKQQMTFLQYHILIIQNLNIAEDYTMLFMLLRSIRKSTSPLLNLSTNIVMLFF
jgi:hypothetical protein